MYFYKVFGLTIGSLLNFNWPLEQIRPVMDVDCEIIKASDPIREPEGDVLYTGPVIAAHISRPQTKLLSTSNGLYLSYCDFGQFEIRQGKITYYLQNVLNQSNLEPILFRVVLVLWLELIGIPVLHASGIVVNDFAIGFLANSTSGKSTLAAAFIHNGAKFLTDDIFPVEVKNAQYLGRPSYAWLRLLPETANALGYKIEGNIANPEKCAVQLNKNYGQFCPEPAPLAALYLPVRQDGIFDSVRIEILPPKKAYLGLVQHTFAGNWLVKSPLTSQRMSFFANLAKTVPIKQLVYPSGYKHLAAVVDTIKQDLDLQRVNDASR